MLRRILDIFRIRRAERWPVAVAAAYFVILNVINVSVYWYSFSVPAKYYHRLFVHNYHVSGFDPLTYVVISNWFPSYNIYRHPLLAFFMYPFYLLNQGLMYVTGLNFATVLTALILVFCSTYSSLFLYRILSDVVGISRRATLIVAALYFSFGFIMLSSMAPDHFVMSQCCILLTIWLAGEKLRRGKALNLWQTLALFTLTAGVSLNNGLKIFLAALVTRRWRFFRLRFLLLAVLVPSAVIWGIAEWEYKTWQWPQEMERKEVKAKKDAKEMQKLRARVADTIAVKDSAAIEAVVQTVMKQRAEAKKVAQSKKLSNRNAGKPIAQEGFMRWTDQSTSRCDAAVENLFGEALQLHRTHALADVLRNRPVVVRYDGMARYANYGVEALVVALFLVGIWCGRRSLFFWTAMSCFLMDMALHMGLGFGINEIYIMSAHYLFVIPIAIAFILKTIEHRRRATNALLTLLALLAVWCLAWNMTVIANYFAA